jgi:hypothetical protein
VLAATCALAPTPAAFGADRFASPRFERPAPSVRRQVDRLERGGAVDPLTRRRLQDQLRQDAPGAVKSGAQRTLERLPDEPAAEPQPRPEPAPTEGLPSSLPPGIGEAGDGGYVVPPGGRGGSR